MSIWGNLVGLVRGLLDFLFGCRHGHLSFPRSDKVLVRSSPVARQTGMYVVCLDCGKQFAYDWHEMRIVKGTGQPASGDHVWELIKAKISSHRA